MNWTASPLAQHPRLAEVLDDLPIWSAPFGLTILDNVRMKRGMAVVDVGCGTGFPTLELAQRLGPGSRVVGVDPWPEAVARARAKVEAWGVSNVEIHQGRAEALPFGDASVDLVVSNNGLNNVQDLDKALAECARVCKPGAQFLFTWNLPETMATVYDAMEDILGRLGLHDAVTDLRRHIFDKRKPVEWMRERAVAAGFTVRRVEEKSFVWRFASPEALMAHGFMRLAFIPAWVEIIPAPHRPAVLDELARRLEVVCARGGEIALGIPYACVDCTR